MAPGGDREVGVTDAVAAAGAQQSQTDSDAGPSNRRGGITPLSDGRKEQSRDKYTEQFFDARRQNFDFDGFSSGGPKAMHGKLRRPRAMHGKLRR